MRLITHSIPKFCCCFPCCCNNSDGGGRFIRLNILRQRDKGNRRACCPPPFSSFFLSPFLLLLTSSLTCPYTCSTPTHLVQRMHIGRALCSPSLSPPICFFLSSVQAKAHILDSHSPSTQLLFMEKIFAQVVVGSVY